MADIENHALPCAKPIIICNDQDPLENLIQEIQPISLINYDTSNIQAQNIQVVNEEILENYDIFPRLFVSIILMIIVYPIIFLDLYYAYNDNSCVNEHFNGITIKIYLEVCSYLSITVTLVALYFIWTVKANGEFNLYNKYPYLQVINNILTFFVFSWTITGLTLFFNNNNKKCTKSVYNYLYVSLLIKIISISFEVLKLFRTKK